VVVRRVLTRVGGDHDEPNVDTVNFLWQVRDCKFTVSTSTAAREFALFYRLGLKIAGRARLVLAASGVVLVISAVLGVGAFGRLLSGGFDDPASASSQAKALLDQKFGGEPDLIFLVHARTGTVDRAAVTAMGQALQHKLTADARLRGVTSYWTAVMH
jgi:hypothetical protein